MSTPAVRSLAGLLLATACSRGDPTAPSAPSPPPAAALEEEAAPSPPMKPAPEPATPEPDEDAAPSERPAEPEPEPAPATPRARSIDEAKGLSVEGLVAEHGEPDEKKGDRWIYRFPRDGGCVDREIVYTLHVRAGAVVDVKRQTRQTGKHCEPAFMP